MSDEAKEPKRYKGRLMSGGPGHNTVIESDQPHICVPVLPRIDPYYLCYDDSGLPAPNTAWTMVYRYAETRSGEGLWIYDHSVNEPEERYQV